MTRPATVQAFKPVPDDGLPPNAVAAATLIIMRPGGQGRPDSICMLRRTRTMAFAPGAWVFPGGRVDEDDRALGARLAPAAGLEVDDASARIAAIRETVEEAGIAPTLVVGPDEIASWRSALAAGASFSVLLERANQWPDLTALVPYARWCPNFRETRVFDTRFYLWRAPTGTVVDACDVREHDAADWIAADAAVAEGQAGSRLHIFPTACNLARLAAAGSFDKAVVDARRHHPVPIVIPKQREWGGEIVLELPGDTGYPVLRHAMRTLRRG